MAGMSTEWSSIILKIEFIFWSRAVQIIFFMYIYHYSFMFWKLYFFRAAKSSILLKTQIKQGARVPWPTQRGKGSVSCVVCLVSCVLCLMSYVLCLMSYVLCRVSYVLCLMSYVLCLMSYFLCLMSYVLGLMS